MGSRFAAIRDAATILRPPEVFPWTCEMKVGDPDGHFLRIKASQRKPPFPPASGWSFRGALIQFEPSVAAFTEQSAQALEAVRSELIRESALRVIVKGIADSQERNSLTLNLDYRRP